MISKIVTALEAGDNKALASCFAEKCRLIDYCPQSAGQYNYYIYGREAVDMFYLNKFTYGIISVIDPVVINDRTANFFISYGGIYRYASAEIKEYEENGLVREMLIGLA